MRPFARKVACAALLAALFLSPTAARADDEAGAAKFFNEGSSAFDRREFPAAALLFEESYRLAPRAPTLYNASVAWERAGNLERASDDLHDAIQSGGLAETAVAPARAHLEEMTRALGSIDIVVPAGVKVSVDHLDRRSGSVRAHVQPGAHLVTAVLPEGEKSWPVNVARGALITVGSVEARPAPLAHAVPPVVPPPEQPAAGHGFPTTAVVLFGVSALAVAGTAVFGEIANGAYHQVLNNPDNLSERTRASTNQALCNASLTAAGVTAAAGIVFLWRPWTSSDGPKATALGLHLGPRSIDLAARF